MGGKACFTVGFEHKTGRMFCLFFMTERPSETISDGLLFLMMVCLRVIEGEGFLA